ncbi:MAG: hypothetical protein ACOY15_10095 [Pseudomonadota bacterium]
MVDLIGHLAWPVTTITFLLLIRRPIGMITTALTARITDPRSSLSASYGDAKLGIVGGGLSATGKKLDDRTNADAAFRLKITEWLENESPGLSITSFLDGAQHEDLRNKAVQHFQL